MSDDTTRPRAWARLRAAILNPVEYAGPREPDAPLDRAYRIRGGEFLCWDARVDAQAILNSLRGFELPHDVEMSITRSIDRPTVGQLRRVRQMLSRREVPQIAKHRCREAADLLTWNIAALGCPVASAECAAASFDSAVTYLGAGDSTDGYAQGFLAFRAACLFASDAQVDATDIEYKPHPIYPRLSGFDQRARYWLASFAVIFKAEDAIANEDDILRGGAGMQSDLSQLVDLPPVHDDWDQPGPSGSRAAQVLTVVPKLSHLPKPSSSALDRRDTPRADYDAIADKPMALRQAPDPHAFVEDGSARSPWLRPLFELIANDIVGADYAWLRPTLLVGGAGSGKTATAVRIAEMLGVPARVYSVNGTMDGSFSGTSRQWSTGRASVPLQAVRQEQVANPLVVLDEIEKGTPDRRNGRLDEAILPFLERESAKRILDPYLECAVDLSAVTYLATANDLYGVPAPLLDRLRIVRIPMPRAEDLPIVAANIVADIREERNQAPSWLPDLDPEELDLLGQHWRGGSLRPLRRLVEAVLAGRDRLAPRH